MPPARDGAHTLVVATQSADGIEQVVAASLDQPVQPIRVETAHLQRVIALLYDDTLEKLGLPAGGLERAAPGKPSKKVPNAQAAFTLAVPDGKAWTASTDLDIDFAIPSTNLCPNLVATSQKVDTMGKFRTAVAIDNDSVLLFMNNGEWWRVDKNSATHLFDRELVSAAWRSDSGELWIVTHDGTLLSGDLDSGFTVTATVPLVMQTVAIDGAPSTAPFELFILLDWSTILHYDGAQMRVVDSRARAGDAFDDIAWVSPGNAIAIGALEREIVRYRDGTASIEDFQNIFNTETPASLVHHPKLGAFLGSQSGFLYRRADTNPAWSMLDLGVPSFGLAVEQMQVWHDGIVLDVGRSQISYYFEGFGACPVLQFGDRHLRTLLVVGESIVLIPDQTVLDVPPYEVLWIDQAP